MYWIQNLKRIIRKLQKLVLFCLVFNFFFSFSSHHSFIHLFISFIKNYLDTNSCCLTPEPNYEIKNLSVYLFEKWMCFSIKDSFLITFYADDCFFFNVGGPAKLQFFHIFLFFFLLYFTNKWKEEKQIGPISVDWSK